MERFLLPRDGGSLFDDETLNFFLSYSMQWVIGWCNLMELRY